MRTFLVFHEEVGLDVGKLFLHPAGHFVELLEDALGVLLGEGDDGFGVARDGVAHVAALDADQAQAALGNPAQVAEDQLVDVGAAAVDFHAAMAALEAAEGQLVGHHALGGLLGGEGDIDGGIDTAGAAHVELALGLAVEVQQVVAVQLAFLQAEGTGHAGLLVGGDEGLQRAVLDGLRGEDAHDGGHAQTVVGSEGGVVGIHPVAHNLGLDGVLQEVVLLAGTGLGHHVHVGLQHHGVHILHAFGGGFAQNDVAHLVHAAVNLVLFCPVHKEFTHNLFVLRGTGALGESIEIAPQLFGFEVFDCHNKVYFLC